MDNNILFIISADDDRGPLGVFDTVGSAIYGAEHILKGDRVPVIGVIISTNSDCDFIARVDGDSGVSIFVRAIEVNECHSIDGIVTLEG
jgi:hypothetical protein